MIDLAAGREAYERFEIDDIGWVATNANIADPFTKTGRNLELEKLVETGRF